MTKFTTYVPAGGPVKPVRQPVTPADNISPLVNLAKGTIGIIGDQGRKRALKDKAEADAKIASDKALTEQALDELSGATFDVMSDRNVKLMLGRLDNVKGATEARATSPARLDMELERVVNTVRQKYPTAQKEIFEWLNNEGYDHYLLQDFRNEQSQVEARRSAFAAQTTSYIDAYTKAGMDPSRPEEYQIDMGRRILWDNNNLERSKLEAEETAATLKAQGLQETARMKDVSQQTRAAYIQVGSNFTQPLYDNLAQLVALAGQDDEKLSGIAEQSGIVMAAVDGFIMEQMADARSSAMLTDDISQVEKYYGDVRGAVSDMFNGDLSTFKSKLRALELMETSGKIAARNQFPTITRLQDAGLGQTMNDILTLTLESSTLATEVRDELIAGLNSENSEAGKSGDKILETLSQVAKTGNYEGQAFEDVTKAAKVQVSTVKRLQGEIASNKLTSVNGITEYLNTHQGLARLAQQYPAVSIDTKTAYGMIDTLASSKARMALQSGRNIDDVRGVMATRASAGAAVNILQSLRMKAAESRKEDSQRTTRGGLGEPIGSPARGIKYDPDRGVYTSYGNFPTLDKMADKMNEAVAFLEWADTEVGLGLPEVFDNPADRREYLVNSTMSQDVMNYLDNQTPQSIADTKNDLSFDTALSQFNTDVVTSMAPKSSAARFLDRTRNMIDAAENGGTGDYDTLYGFSNHNDFADVKVSDMTLAEIDTFEEEYGPWVQERNNGTLATPTGRYQIVGTTRRRLASKLGLSPGTKFTPKVQDLMFEELIFESIENGTPLEDVWVGLK